MVDFYTELEKKYTTDKEKKYYQLSMAESASKCDSEDNSEE